MKLVFIHGWGFNSDFWNGVSKFLPGFKQERIDLGFLGEGSDIPETDEPSLLIGHSLGFLKGLSLSQNWKGWIAINSFPRFITDASKAGCVSLASLRDMRIRLQTDPLKTLHSFHAFIGSVPPEGTPNPLRLREGLDALGLLDAEQLKADTYRSLVLASHNDPLVPLATSEALAHKKDILWHPTGGHVLPLIDPSWCANAIQSFIEKHA